MMVISQAFVFIDLHCRLPKCTISHKKIAVNFLRITRSNDLKNTIKIKITVYLKMQIIHTRNDLNIE